MSNINTYFDKIFIINLYWREDRLKPLLKRLEANGITNYKVIDAYVGEMFKGYDVTNRFSYKSGAFGCLFSHLRCIHEALNKGYERILILEDDVKLYNNFNESFDTITNQLDNDWDLLYLGHQTIGGNKKHETLYEEGRNVFKAGNNWGCHAYGLSKRLMEEVYDAFTVKGSNPHLEIDTRFVLKTQRDDNFKCFKVYPQLFIQDVIKSDITGVPRLNFFHMVNPSYSKFEDYK